MAIAVELTTEGPAAILRAEGVLDEMGATQLHCKVLEAMDTGFRNIVLNLSGVTNMTPDGLMLLETIRHDVALCDAQLILTLPRREVADILRLYGLKNHLTILPSEKDALRQVDGSIPAGWRDS